MVHLQSTPVTNSTIFQLSLLNNGAAVANLASGQARALTLWFDEIRVGMPPVHTVHQNPPAAIAVHPGNLGSFSSAGNNIVFSYAMPNHTENRVVFT